MYRMKRYLVFSLATWLGKSKFIYRYIFSSKYSFKPNVGLDLANSVINFMMKTFLLSSFIHLLYKLCRQSSRPQTVSQQYQIHSQLRLNHFVQASGLALAFLQHIHLPETIRQRCCQQLELAKYTCNYTFLRQKKEQLCQ